MEQLLNRMLEDKAKKAQGTSSGIVGAQPISTTNDTNVDQPIIVPYSELSSAMLDQIVTPSASAVYDTTNRLPNQGSLVLAMPIQDIGIDAANIAALNNITALRNSLTARRRHIDGYGSDTASVESYLPADVPSPVESNVSDRDMIICCNCGHPANYKVASDLNIEFEAAVQPKVSLPDVSNLLLTGAGTQSQVLGPAIIDTVIVSKNNDNLVTSRSDAKPIPKPKPKSIAVDFTVIKGRSLFAENAPVGYIGDRHVDKIIAKYASLSSYVDQNGSILAFAKCVRYGSKVHQLKANGRFPTVYTGNRCKLAFSQSNDGYASSLIMKGVLLGLTIGYSNKMPIPSVWTSYRGTRNIQNVAKMVGKEYELIRMLNQPYPYTEQDYVWHKVNIPMSNLNVGRPKGALVTVDNYWSTFLSMIEKLGLVAQFCEILSDTLGLCEYLAALNSTTCKISGLSDGTDDLVYHPQGTDTRITYDIKDLLVASVVMGDELLLIHCKSGKLTRHVDQWNTLFRRSILQNNGTATRAATSLSYAILAQDGYRQCIMPGTEHCSNVFNDKMLEWLGDTADKLATTTLYDSELHKGTARATYFLDTSHMAMAHGYETFANMITDSCFKAMLFYDAGKGLLHKLGTGTETMIIIEITSRIVVLSNFGRHRYKLTKHQLDSLTAFKEKYPGYYK